MRIKFMLLLLFALPLATRADSFNFTFTPNQAECTRLGVTDCSHTGSGVFTTGPLTFNMAWRSTGGWGYLVTSIAGTFDGFSMSIDPQANFGAIGGAGISLIACCTNPIVFIANGQQWWLWHNDLQPTGNYLSTLNFNEPIDVTITAPEPSTLLFLGIGLVGVMGLTLFKNRLS